MSRLTSRRIPLAFTLSLAVAVLALAACGGGDSTTSSATATTSGHNTNTATPNSNATKTEQATATSGSSTDIASELQALGGNIQQATGKITYTDTNTDGTTSTLTYYSGPPNFRYDSTGSDGTLTIYIETPQTTYICDSSSQGCIATAGSGTGSAGLGLLSGFFSPALIDAISAAAQAQGITITKTNETIAGTNATCFQGTSNGSTDKFCFSDSGVLLSTLTTDASGGTSGLTATAYSGAVSSSDFQPPYPVTTIPATP